MARYIDLSHPITNGMVTFPGIPAPRISEYMSFEASQDHYAEGTEFSIGAIDLVANTGTYIDTPAHRHRGGWDLTGLNLEMVADVPGVVIRCRSEPIEIPASVLEGVAVSGRAVLFDTGWSDRWGTEGYFTGHPYLGLETIAVLVASRPAVVGIDSLNLDGMADGSRPAHTALLGDGIPIIEHMTGLEKLPGSGFRFFAVPPRIEGMATFPVRSFAIIDGEV